MSTCAGCGTSIPPSRGGPPRKWCSERCRKGQYAEPCERCGAPHGGRANRAGGQRPQRYCHSCALIVSGETSRAKHLPRRELIERLWREGDTARQICEKVGVPYYKPAIAKWRERGYDLPHRRPDMIVWGKRLSEKRLAA